MGTKGTCKLDGCEGEVRGKGYCDRHYRAWRRGKLPKARYRTCNEKGCTKPTHHRGLCEEHFKSVYGKRSKAAAAAAEGGTAAAKETPAESGSEGAATTEASA